MATDERYVESICGQALRNASFDVDTSSFSQCVYDATKHMLSERVDVVPGEDTEETVHVKSVLCEWYLGFYMMALDFELGGSIADYCAQHVVDALDGYVVESYDDTSAMLDDIAPVVERALDPDRLYSELASIGIE